MKMTIENFPLAKELRNSEGYQKNIDAAKQIILDYILEALENFNHSTKIAASEFSKVNFKFFDDKEAFSRWLTDTGLIQFLLEKEYEVVVDYEKEVDYRGDVWDNLVLEIFW